MKKIKFFFIRHYQRIIRFLISFSAIGCILAASFSASATAVYSMSCSPIQYDSQSCYLEIVRNDGFHFVIYVTPRYAQATPQPSSISYYAVFENNTLTIYPTLTAYAPDTGDGSILPATLSIVGYYIDQNGFSNVLQSSNNGSYASWSFVNSFISGIHGYNCQINGIGAGLDFVFTYGSDRVIDEKIDNINQAIRDNQNATNDRLDRIISAIEGNKSSAEKSEYNGVSADQKTAQADLDKAEASINADTATARTDTINLFKSFSIVGDIAKGMLAVTNIFNVLTGDLVFAPALLNFALAVGAAAFLLGLSAIILKVVHFKQ